MRALCGAIIIAGSLIGLGLTGVGYGIRYAAVPNTEYLRLHSLDTALLLILTTMIATLVIGIAVAFMGLAYHHERRHHELLLSKSKPSNGLHVTT
jgi:hypothetical protein